MKDKVSIIIPAYNEEKNIEITAGKVLSIMDENSINCEIVFVSDGSTDGTFDEIVKYSKKDNRVKGIEFSRNFGKEAAMFAGIEKASGDAMVVMDCDLQHPPETIVKMYALWQEGFEIVEGIKMQRGKESIFHKAMAFLFYGAMSHYVGFDMNNTSDFKLFDREVAKVLLSMPERKTFFRAMSFWTGFKSCNISYEVADRQIGTTKWSFKKLVQYAVNNIVSFTTAPLNIVTYIGIIMFVFMTILGVQTLVKYLSGQAVEGFTTVILLLLLIGCGIFMGLGIIGRYVAAIYDEVKQRPRYIIWHDTDELKEREQ